MLQDDDVFHHAETLDAFAWGRMAAPDQILGTYPERNFRLDAATGEYEYVFHPRKTASKQYSFLLGQTSVVRRDTIDGFIHCGKDCVVATGLCGRLRAWQWQPPPDCVSLSLTAITTKRVRISIAVSYTHLTLPTKA